MEPSRSRTLAKALLYVAGYTDKETWVVGFICNPVDLITTLQAPQKGREGPLEFAAIAECHLSITLPLLKS